MRYLVPAVLFVTSIVAFSLSCGDDEEEGDNIGSPSPEDFANYVWVAYSPTNFNPNGGQYPTDDQIRQDLATLKTGGFTGIVTYSSDDHLKVIPRLAREAGFKACIMGIYYYDENAVREEITNAIAAKDYVDGYCVGNEGFLEGRYTMAQLGAVMGQVRNGTSKPISTSEPGGFYLDGSDRANWLIAHSHWLFPNSYPVYADIYNPAKGVSWMQDQYNQTKNKANGKLVIFKETGWPTGGDSSATAYATEENQRTYFKGLAATSVNFAYFEAFDQPWKLGEPHNYGPYWGLYDQNRKPKLFMQGGPVQ